MSADQISHILCSAEKEKKKKKIKKKKKKKIPKPYVITWLPRFLVCAAKVKFWFTCPELPSK